MGCVCNVTCTVLPPHSFAALFSPAKRRQLEKVLDGTTRRSILGARTPDVDEEDGGE